MLSTRLFSARWFWLIISFVPVMFLSGTRAHAATAVTCQGNNLQVTWDSLLTPVTVRVNGADAVTGGPANGSTLVMGPGSWTIEILQNGDPVSTHTAGCPASQPAPRDPNRIDNGSDAGLNVPFKRKSGGFDLYTYNPRNQTSVLLFSLTCEQQIGAARQSAQLHAQGQVPNVNLFTGHDYQGREVAVWFVYPDQIQVNGYFDDGKPHIFNFAACSDARQLAVPTPTSIARPVLTIVASCKGNVATFVVTNNGGDMREPGRYLISVPPARIVSGAAIQLQAGASQTLTVQGHYTTLTAVVHSGGGSSAQAQTTCTRPHLAVSVICNDDIFIVGVSNQGGDMVTDGDLHVWSVVSRGTPGKSFRTPLRIKAGATVRHVFPYGGKRVSGTIAIDGRVMEVFTCGTDPALILAILCDNGKASFAIQNNTGNQLRIALAASVDPNPYLDNDTVVLFVTRITLAPWQQHLINPRPVQRGEVRLAAVSTIDGFQEIRKSC
jgi:hypothetical protein